MTYSVLLLYLDKNLKGLKSNHIYLLFSFDTGPENSTQRTWYWHTPLVVIYIFVLLSWVSLVAQMVKNLPEMWEIRVQLLGQEDPLEKWMAIHYSIPAWRIPWTEESGRIQSMVLQMSQTQLRE